MKELICKVGKIKVFKILDNTFDLYVNKNYKTINLPKILEKSINLALENKQFMNDDYEIILQEILNIKDNKGLENILGSELKKHPQAHINADEKLIYLNIDVIIAILFKYHKELDNHMIKDLIIDISDLIINKSIKINYEINTKILSKYKSLEKKYGHLETQIYRKYDDLKDVIDDRSYIWFKTRLLIQYIITNIIINGLSEIGENHEYYIKELNTETIKKDYEDAKKSMIEIKRVVNNLINIVNKNLIDINDDEKRIIFNEKEFHKMFHEHITKIGTHIFQVILFNSEDLDFEKIIKLRYSKIIKTYVKHCNKLLNIKPIISFNDKNAIYVHYDMIKELTKIRKKYKIIKLKRDLEKKLMKIITMHKIEDLKDLPHEINDFKVPLNKTYNPDVNIAKK